MSEKSAKEPTPDRYEVIETRSISQITSVRLYEETVDHIHEEHPELQVHLPSVRGAITSTISNPTHVEADPRGSYIFVDEATTNSSGNPLRVPVKAVEGTSGLVKTAFFAETKSSRTIVWRQE